MVIMILLVWLDFLEFWHLPSGNEAICANDSESSVQISENQTEHLGSVDLNLVDFLKGVGIEDRDCLNRNLRVSWTHFFLSSCSTLSLALFGSFLNLSGVFLNCKEVLTTL